MLYRVLEKVREDPDTVFSSCCGQARALAGIMTRDIRSCIHVMHNGAREIFTQQANVDSSESSIVEHKRVIARL